MFLPIGTDRPLKRPTLINHALIASAAAVFIAQLATQNSELGARLLEHATLRPTNFVWWNLLSYQFLHADLMHLAGNMLFLWVFGPNIEDRLGRTAYLAHYLLGGVAAGAIHTAFDHSPVIGASGAIAAVTGAYIVFFPRTHIKVLLFFFLIGVYSIPAVWFIGFAIARDLFWTGVGGTNVATLAHLGGYAFGFAVALTLLAVHVVPREPYDLFTLGRQAKRRRDFKSAVASGATPWAHQPHEKIRAKKTPPPDPAAEQLAERRADIAAAAREGDRDRALSLYTALAAQAPGASMNRALQLELAGWLFERGDHPAADDAYDRYLTSNPADAEAHRVRLLSALIRARYTADPAGAAARLDDITPERLTESEHALYDALRAETS